MKRKERSNNSDTNSVNVRYRSTPTKAMIGFET
jgi:hypothetical protein